MNIIERSQKVFQETWQQEIEAGQATDAAYQKARQALEQVRAHPENYPDDHPPECYCQKCAPWLWPNMTSHFAS